MTLSAVDVVTIVAIVKPVLILADGAFWTSPRCVLACVTSCALGCALQSAGETVASSALSRSELRGLHLEFCDLPVKLYEALANLALLCFQLSDALPQPRFGFGQRAPSFLQGRHGYHPIVTQ